MKEIWKEISWARGFYAVSNLGRVKRLKPARKRSTHVGRILKPGLAGHGYPVVMLHLDDGWSRTIYVHRLVLEEFVGPRPSEQHVVNHKNGLKSDSRLENLHWVTYSYNNQHAIDNGLRSYARGSEHRLYKVPVTDPRHPMFGKSGEANPFFGKRHSEATKKAIADKLVGRKLSPEHRANIGKGVRLHLTKDPDIK
jgi:hypothetical protein